MIKGTNDKDAISMLINMLKDKDLFLRNVAAIAIKGVHDKDAISALIALLKYDENIVIHYNVIDALEGTNDKDAIQALVNMLKNPRCGNT